jgi:hypothetical protein
VGATSIVSTRCFSPFALFHPRDLSALFASTAYNGRTQENLGIGVNGSNHFNTTGFVSPAAKL